MAQGKLLDLNTIPESPAKRRRTEDIKTTQRSKPYDSQDDSGDDLFTYETLETIPLPKPVTQDPVGLTEATFPTQRQKYLASSDMASQCHATQPTQLLNTPVGPRLDSTGRKPSIVQVAASSPLREPPKPSPLRYGGVLASAMAPPGTAFRLPYGVQKSPQMPFVIDLSDDDGPQYRGDSSDENDLRQRTTDIRPSTFGRSVRSPLGRDQTTERTEESPIAGNSRFKEITGSSFYKPLDKAKPVGSSSAATSSGASKRTAADMATPYTGTSRPTKLPKQSGPARAQPVADIGLNDILDFNLRKKVERMKTILPNAAYISCRDALLACRGNFDDAMDKILSQPERNRRTEVDLTLGSDDDGPTTQSTIPGKLTSKRQIKAPARTIQDKWSSTQVATTQIQHSQSSPPVTLKKPKRKLVRGRKDPSSQASEPVRPVSSREIDSGDDSDSGIQSEPEEDDELEGKVLTFFNTCSVKDLADIANTTEEVAGVILSQKPFASLEDVRQVSSDVPAATTKGKRKSTKKPIGDKIVDICLEMWTGYEAVDDLVTRCEGLGKPLAEAIKKWGVDVFGAAKNGELELLNFGDSQESKNDASSIRDSGIGTPSGSAAGSAEEGDFDIKIVSTSRSKKKNNQDTFVKQPSIMGENVELKDYQVVGLNWLVLLWQHRLSCILADEMGLGKTCQVISFLTHLFENQGVKGPHLIVVPSSTLENWLREFKTFSPQLTVEPYYGLQKERVEQRARIDANRSKINVIITTYQTASGNSIDSKFLRHQKPVVCVYDEGHYLKNSNSSRYAALMRIPAQFRVLLTGTPLQNNLQELASLLAFILPSVFRERREDLAYIFKHKAKTTDDGHSALLSAQRIARAKSMLTPFVLRRKKYQVLKDLPEKTCRVVYCEPTQSQWEVYSGELAKAREAVEARAAGKKPDKEQNNVMMQLRKAAIHPMLFRRLFDNSKIRKMSTACLREPEWCDRDADAVYEDMEYMSDFELYKFCNDYPDTMARYNIRGEEWMDSGKVQKLCELLLEFRANGDRVLLFSQFTLVLNILEVVLDTLSMQYFRLDGSTKVEERQDMIDQFNNEEDVMVFLLSTKAGGSGINLASANKVIIFDLSFNPQEDLQAENRAHRVGQKREVEVIRLVMKGTIEEQIHALGETKLALDSRVSGEETEEKEAKQAEGQGEEMVAKMMLEQVSALNA